MKHSRKNRISKLLAAIASVALVLGLMPSMALADDQVTISVTVNPKDSGTFEGAGVYAKGKMITLKAIPNDGYEFVNWTENGTQVSNKAEWDDFKVQCDKTLVVNFAPKNYDISATADPAVGGSVTGGGTFAYGQKATLTAKASEGYVFDYWSTANEPNACLCATEEYEFNVTGSKKYVAHFKKILIVEPDGTQLQSRTYTGSSITFPIKVYLEGVDGLSQTVLEEVVDYVSEFTDNVDVGKGKVTVRLKDPREGTATATFDIVAADISTAKVEVADQVYGGTELKPVPTVTWGNKAVGTDDYTAKYTDNVRVGAATVVVEGKHNFYGETKAATFMIAERPVTITADSAERDYDGTALTDDGFTSEGLAKGDRVASAKVEGSQTEAGSSANKVSGAKIVNAAGEDVTDCYDIAYKSGTLTVNPVYEATSGSGSTWTKGSTDPLTFPFKRGGGDGITFDLFKGVEVDGKAVPEKDASGNVNWTAKKGSLILSLQPSFLETLADGDHTVKALFEDGSGEATFKVASKAAPADSKATSSSSAKTGDTLPVTVVMATLLLSGTMAALSRRKLEATHPAKRGKHIK